jgi:hypothetical protein
MFNSKGEEAMNFYKDYFQSEIGYMGSYGNSPKYIVDDQKK